MSQKHTLDERNNLSREELITMVLTMQGQLRCCFEADPLVSALLRIHPGGHRLCRHKLLHNSMVEPEADEVISVKKKKTKGQRELDLKGKVRK